MCALALFITFGLMVVYCCSDTRGHGAGSGQGNAAVTAAHSVMAAPATAGQARLLAGSTDEDVQVICELGGDVLYPVENCMAAHIRTFGTAQRCACTPLLMASGCKHFALTASTVASGQAWSSCGVAHAWPGPGQVWFEVSKHSGRVHIHSDASGTRPLGLSIPLETLLAEEGEHTLQELRDMLHMG